MVLQPARRTDRNVSPLPRWALTPPFHPYRPIRDGGRSLLRCYPLARIFPLGSAALCVARTFLPSRFTNRSEFRFSGAAVEPPCYADGKGNNCAKLSGRRPKIFPLEIRVPQKQSYLYLAALSGTIVPRVRQYGNPSAEPATILQTASTTAYRTEYKRRSICREHFGRAGAGRVISAARTRRASYLADRAPGHASCVPRRRPARQSPYR